MSRPKSDYSIQTVSNALRTLEAFYSENEIGVSELSRRLGLHKNNIFRLLATLEERGYIEQSTATERYRLGTRCLELGQAFSRGNVLLRRARPILEELVQKLGETAHLAVLRDFEVVHVDGVMSEQMLLTALRVGQRLPVHCTALGKVLLGCAEQTVQKGYAQLITAGDGLVARTESTIVDSQKLFGELGAVAARGFAVDLEECEAGMRCLAAPTYDAAGRVVAALSISGPSGRLPEEGLHADLGRAVIASANQLSQELGYSG